MDVPSIELVSVNVGLPAPLGPHRGRMVHSAIVKRPVEVDTIAVTTLNLAGDQQADRRVHGGPDKAVYAYPSEHLAGWNDELGLDAGPGFFGENLTTGGATESEVVIGDRWRWGAVLLEICQPRSPCFKLALRSRQSRIGPRMLSTGRSGWYARVVEAGSAPTTGGLHLEHRPTHGVTVLDSWWARFDRDASEDEQERVLAAPELAAEWRWSIERRMELQ